jgi:hypothetical protein
MVRARCVTRCTNNAPPRISVAKVSCHIASRGHAAQRSIFPMNLYYVKVEGADAAIKDFG